MSHAKFPPSGAERWLKCGYSVKMLPFYPDKETAASKEGTRQHAIAAMHLNYATDSCDPKMQTYLDTVRSEPGDMFVERKVTIVPELCWGTADAFKLGNYLSLFDLKWGKSMVHATKNPQLRLYALGVLREFPLPRDASVELAIVQPNGATGWPTRRWNTTVQEILEFKPEVMRAIDVALGPNPPAVAGAYCFFCPAKIHCPAYLLAHGKK